MVERKNRDLSRNQFLYVFIFFHIRWLVYAMPKSFDTIGKECHDCGQIGKVCSVVVK